jgi:Trk K+ transport system NAD-binding subunit/mannitol/fructose-specific phosphotransferase system IIA component (Ntr-type)/Kef-type K+ transport system membrane component KefB
VDYLKEILVFVAGFAIIALAAKQVGQFFAKAALPLLTGFLFTGILAGPSVLGLIPEEAIEKLRFVDQIALAFIAFAAGGELYLKELRSRLKTIAWMTVGLVSCTFILGSLTVYMLADRIPFMQDMPASWRVAVSILAGAILVARSPSSAIAVVNELRAKGPFTQTSLGVTVIMDVVVITLFAVNSSIADALLTDMGLNPGFLFLLAGELVVSLAVAFALAGLLHLILSVRIGGRVKKGLILLAGYSAFALSDVVRHITHDKLSFEVLLEPLLICMIAGFLVTNYSRYRTEFSVILNDIGPPIYIAFFTLTGASLALGVLAKIWQIALILFAVRLVAIFIGSVGGGIAAGDSMKHNRISWMAYVTQAGVGLGLAKQVVVEFPLWGTDFATMIIAVIVLNQIIGPPMFKWAIRFVGESHTRAEPTGFARVHQAIIFGLEGQSQALAGTLRSHGCQVKIAAMDVSGEDIEESEGVIYPISSLSLDVLRELNAEHAEAIVCMLSDEENYQICQLAYEHFGTDSLVVRLNDRAYFNRFHELGALIVDPATAVLSLLDHFVRSPLATSLLLGLEENQDAAELELRNPNLHGLALRDLRLPMDTIVLSVSRRGQMLISHGYTRLEIGDRVTLVGARKSLEEVALRFDTDREQALFHLIETVSPKELTTGAFEAEVKGIMEEEERAPQDRFDMFIEESPVIDIDHAIEVEEFFRLVADTMSPGVNVKPDVMLQLLAEREKQSSTAITPGVAIPHMIIEGEHTFSILLARCKQGIVFSEAAPMVFAAFVLVGTQDERNFHLRALSAIAQIVQDPNFERKWMRARGENGLRNVVLSGKRMRQG